MPISGIARTPVFDKNRNCVNLKAPMILAARALTEATFWHGGKAAASRKAVIALPKAGHTLIKFLACYRPRCKGSVRLCRKSGCRTRADVIGTPASSGFLLTDGFGTVSVTIDQAIVPITNGNALWTTTLLP